MASDNDEIKTAAQVVEDNLKKMDEMFEQNLAVYGKTFIDTLRKMVNAGGTYGCLGFSGESGGDLTLVIGIGVAHTAQPLKEALDTFQAQLESENAEAVH